MGKEIPLFERQITLLLSYDENKHPRDKSGHWAKKAAVGAAAATVIGATGIASNKIHKKIMGGSPFKTKHTYKLKIKEITERLHDEIKFHKFSKDIKEFRKRTGKPIGNPTRDVKNLYNFIKNKKPVVKPVVKSTIFNSKIKRAKLAAIALKKAFSTGYKTRKIVEKLGKVF